jgi:hypothetical protein
MERGRPLAEVDNQFAGLLGGGPLPGRVGGDADDVHPAGHYLHHHQNIDAPERDLSRWKKSVASSPWAWVRSKASPTGVDATRCGPTRGTGQDPADRSGADPVTEADQLTFDAVMSPARVSRASWMTRSRIPPVTGGRPDRFGCPVSLDQSAVPGQQPAWRNGTAMQRWSTEAIAAPKFASGCPQALPSERLGCPRFTCASPVFGASGSPRYPRRGPQTRARWFVPFDVGQSGWR